MLCYVMLCYVMQVSKCRVFKSTKRGEKGRQRKDEERGEKGSRVSKSN
jgi:hypothetical protein